MFAERLLENFYCGNIWKKKSTISIAFPNVKHKIIIIYYEVDFFQGETHFYGGLDGFYFQNPAENIWFINLRLRKA